MSALYTRADTLDQDKKVTILNDRKLSPAQSYQLKKTRNETLGFCLDERASDRKPQYVVNYMMLYREAGREASNEFKKVSDMYVTHLLARI